MEYRSYTKKIGTYTKKLCYAACLASVLSCSGKTTCKTLPEKKTFQTPIKENIIPHIDITHDSYFSANNDCYKITLDQEDIIQDTIGWEVIGNKYLHDPTNKTLQQLKKNSVDDILSVMEQLGLYMGCRNHKDLKTWVSFIQSVPYHLDDIEDPMTCDTILYGKPFSWGLVEGGNCYWHVLYAGVGANMLGFDNIEALHIYPPEKHIHNKKVVYKRHHMMLGVCLNNEYSPWEMTAVGNDLGVIHEDRYGGEQVAIEGLTSYANIE